MNSKIERYKKLVEERKKCNKCFYYSPVRLMNASIISGGKYDTNEIGQWSIWQNSLDADIMLIGKDFSNVEYFNKNEGMDSPNNPTNLKII